MEIQETIDSKYIIIEKKGHGATASVYLVKEINKDTVYAAKVLKKSSELFDKEIQILTELKNQGNDNKYIVNIVDSGEGLIIRKNRPQLTRQYLVLEYASKGELFNYIYAAKSGLNELYSKVIFAKILKGLQACHNAGICHRDLKMQNILVDENFNPKICDFGFATKNDHLLTEYLGTRAYAAPEILKNQPYDGFKADIFSLGVVLLTLTTCKIGFFEASKSDPFYRLIALKHFEKYWLAVSKQIKGISQQFKKLFIKMVSYNPAERPTIEEILNSDWMKEIRDMNQAQIEQLEAKIRNEFLLRENEVNKVMKQEMEVEKQMSEEAAGGYKGCDDEGEFFDLSLKPKYAKTGLNMDNYIKIKGNMNNPCKFMNKLVNKIKQEYGDECTIETCNNKLKFNDIFEEKKDFDIPDDIKEELEKMEIEDEEVGENNKIKGNDTHIQVKLYESYNGGYLLRYVRKEGNEKDFLDKMTKISSFVKNIL